MEYPFGHNHRHTHHNRNDDRENEERQPPCHHHNEFVPPSQPPQHQHNEFAPPPHYQPTSFDGPSPPPPSPYFQQPGFAAPPPAQPPSYHQQTVYPPPPSHVTHLHHSGGTQQPDYSSSNYSPPAAHVTHVAHESSHQRVDHQIEGHHSFRPHLPSIPHDHSHSASLSELSKKPTVKVYCKANPGFHLTIRDGKVILAPSDPSDEFQHWYKDEKYSTRAKDEVGFPSFALVNKVTGQAIKHSVGATHPVQLTPYKSDQLDESILWSESTDLGDGYRAVRMINNIRLNVDAFNGDKKSGGVHDGTTIVLWQWNKGDNQRWKIVPY
ncbi:hypothetical protein QQP08_018165 [Theobroma cacao]|nr:hypothetical protein QQP08_018165 [Theobroma cacao]